MTARQPRARKPKGRRKPMPRLHSAVADFVKKHGGKVVVTGPVEIHRWPGAHPYNFRIAVYCTGIAPTLKGKRNG